MVIATGDRSPRTEKSPDAARAQNDARPDVAPIVPMPEGTPITIRVELTLGYRPLDRIP